VVELETRVALPVVLASIDGGPPRPFVLDTGAATSFLPAGAQAPPGSTTLRSLRVGGLTFRDVPAQRAELPADFPAAGILSPQQAFRGALVELDGRALALRLYRDLDEAGWRAQVGEPVHAVALRWAEDGTPVVDASVAGRPLALRLDLGAGACTLPRVELDRLGFAGRDEVSVPVAVGASRPGTEQVFALEGPGAVGFPWFLGRRAALTADRAILLFTERR